MIGIATATLMTLVNQVSGTPYVTGGDTPAGTDCSGLVSWVANAATGRPVYGDRFHTGNQESALLARGFRYGTEPGALNIGWNSGHTAATLPDGTPVSSGESGGVKVGGGGAFQSQFNHHMYLPTTEAVDAAPAPLDPFAPPPPPPPMDPFAPPPPLPAPGAVPAQFAPPAPEVAPPPAPDFGLPPAPPEVIPAPAPELLPPGDVLPPPPGEPMPPVNGVPNQVV